MEGLAAVVNKRHFDSIAVKDGVVMNKSCACIGRIVEQQLGVSVVESMFVQFQAQRFHRSHQLLEMFDDLWR